MPSKYIGTNSKHGRLPAVGGDREMEVAFELVAKLNEGMECDKAKYQCGTVMSRQEFDKCCRYEMKPDGRPYPWQKEFHDAGAHYAERIIMAANQCVTHGQKIEMVDGDLQARFVKIGDQVLSWDGDMVVPGTVSAIVDKPAEPILRVSFCGVEGQSSLETAAGHRWLTGSGWQHVSTSLLARFGESDNRLVRAASDPNWKEIERDFLAGYLTSFDFCGERLPLRSRNDPDAFPLLNGVLRRMGLSSYAGGPVGKYIDSLWRSLRRLSNQGADRLRAALASAFGFGTVCSDGIPCPANSQSFWQSSKLVNLLSRPYDAVRQDQKLDVSALVDPNRPGSYLSIVGYEWLDSEPLIDFTIEKYHNYIAGGAINHNSGKTRSCGLEVNYHATGRYPGWWEGKRYKNAVKICIGSQTNETLVDPQQLELWGPMKPESKDPSGKGWVPGDAIVSWSYRQCGISGVFDEVKVRHVSGGISTVKAKCHPAGERVLMSDGAWRAIETLRVGDSISCADGYKRVVDQCHAYADRDVYEVKTNAGSIRGTDNHPMFVNGNKVRIDELKVGEVLELAYPEGDTKLDADLWRIKLTALMIGDGCLRAKTPIFTCANEDFLQQIKDCLPDDLVVKKNGQSRPYDYKISSLIPNHNRLKDCMVDDGLWGHCSYEKRIPSWVFQLPRNLRVVFARWLWSCDGSVNEKQAYYSTCNPLLASDVRLLLVSLGIKANIKCSPSSYYRNKNGEKVYARNAYRIGLYGENRIAFDTIGKIGQDVKASLEPRNKPYGTVLSVEKVSTETVYGVGIPDVHELIVEGFRTGNTYEQGWVKWQGAQYDIYWLDEEPENDDKLYSEVLRGILTRGGIVIVSRTPLFGMTHMIKNFMESDGRCYVKNVTFDETPHLTNAQKEKFLAGVPHHERETRSRGIPMLGEGAVYPVADDSLVCKPFAIPKYYKQIVGLDFGVDHPTAACWIAYNPDTDVIYIYDIYRQRRETVANHAEAIRNRGYWIPIAWPHDGLMKDRAGSGVNLMELYKSAHCKMLYQSARYKDDVGGGQAREPIIHECYERMVGGRLKVFNNLPLWFEEKRMYHRKDNKIVDVGDDILSAMHYAIMMLRYAKSDVKVRYQSEAVSVDPYKQFRYAQ